THVDGVVARTHVEVGRHARTVDVDRVVAGPGDHRHVRGVVVGEPGKGSSADRRAGDGINIVESPCVVVHLDAGRSVAVDDDVPLEVVEVPVADLDQVAAVGVDRYAHT